MKSPKEKFTIAKPCHENWANMLPEEKGKFCQACSKSVIDFSSQSIDEILAYFKKNRDEKTCARFSSLQLQMLNSMPPKSSPKWRTWLAVFTGLLSVASLNSCNEVESTTYEEKHQEQKLANVEKPSTESPISFYVKSSLDSTVIAEAEIKTWDTEKVFYSDENGKVILPKELYNSSEVFIHHEDFEVKKINLNHIKTISDIYLFPTSYQTMGEVDCNIDDCDNFVMGEVIF